MSRDFRNRKLWLAYLLGASVSAVCLISIASPLPGRDARAMLLIVVITFPLITLPLPIEASALSASKVSSRSAASRAYRRKLTVMAALGGAIPGVTLLLFWAFVPLSPREFPLFLGYLCSTIACLCITWRMCKHRLVCGVVEELAVMPSSGGSTESANVSRSEIPAKFLVIPRRAYIVISLLAWISLLVPFSPVFSLRSLGFQALLFAFVVLLGLGGLAVTIQTRRRKLNYLPALVATIMSWYVAIIVIWCYATKISNS